MKPKKTNKAKAVKQPKQKTQPTAAQFKQARQEILGLANCYEPKKRKVLRGVFYDKRSECFRYIGEAHDYSWHPEQ